MKWEKNKLTGNITELTRAPDREDLFGRFWDDADFIECPNCGPMGLCVSAISRDMAIEYLHCTTCGRTWSKPFHTGNR